MYREESVGGGKVLANMVHWLHTGDVINNILTIVEPYFSLSEKVINTERL